MPKHKNLATMDKMHREIIQLDKDTFTACAPAKLNITLSIVNRGEDGMHDLSSVMQTVTLHDQVTLKKVKRGEEGLEGDFIKDNIMARAISELSKAVGKELPCKLHLDKKIPSSAGMGGGSSDAAAVLRLANRAFDLGMDVHALEKVAQRIGNDVSFLLHGGRACVEGAREHIITEMATPDLFYVIARPEMELSTKEMYELHDKTGKDFTKLASELCPDTKKLLEELRKGETVESGVTGKGPTVFAAYKTFKECEEARKRISWLKGDIFIEKSTAKLL